MAISDQWLMYFVVGFMSGIVIIKTSPIWVAGYQWLKMIPTRLKNRYISYWVSKQIQQEAIWADEKDLCTRCGYGFYNYQIQKNQPFPAQWGVGRYCLNPNDPHYWISRQGMTEEKAILVYKENIAELEKRRMDNL